MATQTVVPADGVVSFVVPAGVTKLTVDAVGGAGGAYTGRTRGKGGRDGGTRPGTRRRRLMAYTYREFSLSSNSARSTCQVVGNKLYTVVRPTSLGVASYMQVVDLATETIATTVTLPTQLEGVDLKDVSFNGADAFLGTQNVVRSNVKGLKRSPQRQGLLV